MTKFDQVVEAVMQRLEAERTGIEDDRLEQLAFDMRFRPHGGPPRSVKVQLLHTLEPVAGRNGGSAAPRS